VVGRREEKEEDGEGVSVGGLTRIVGHNRREW